MKISAQLDADLTDKMKYLMRSRGESVSDIIKASIEEYYERCKGQADSAQILEQTGFIGCAEGPVDLSENYKEYLDDDLNE